MTDSNSRDVDSAYAGLRRQLFDLKADDLGFSPSLEAPRVFVAVMDVGFAHGVATLVSMIDGTTSLYTSGGGGIIGTGEQEDVAAASRVYATSTDQALEHLFKTDDVGLPADGEVILRALTYDGAYAGVASVTDLQTGLHPLSRAYAAAQLVITAVRLVEEAPEAT
jgi:hypothetical protein